MSLLEESLKQKADKPDTKKAWSSPKISGRLFLDSINFIDQNTASKTDNGNMPNVTGFRELRLGVSGNGYDAFDYKVEVGFQNGTGQVVLIDNWIGAKNVPLLGYVRAGHFKPETGLYYPMSSNNISLMEYTAAANIFNLGRRIGISSENLFAHDRVRLFFGVFTNEGADASRRIVSDNQGQVVNVRLTTAPWFGQEGKYVLHLGGHWEYAGTSNRPSSPPDPPRRTSLSATPGTFGHSIASTLAAENFANDYSHRGGLEFAYQCGRFSTRSELFAGSFSACGTEPGRHLYGTYVELAYFLTDAFRTYDLTSGSFGGVKMKRNFHPFKCGEWNLVDGLGAWQAVFQWSYVDMEDWRARANTIGGHQNDFVAGLNWFWTPQLRWIFEYVHSNQCVGPGYSHRSQDIFATSLRVHF